MRVTCVGASLSTRRADLSMAKSTPPEIMRVNEGKLSSITKEQIGQSLASITFYHYRSDTPIFLFLSFTELFHLNYTLTGSRSPDSSRSYFSQTINMANTASSQHFPPNEDQGPHILASTIALMVLPTMFIMLRLLSRYFARAGFGVRCISQFIYGLTN